MGLRLKQPIYAFNTMPGHMRRGDKVGQTIITNLYETQTEVGISSEFYKEDSKKYPYITAHTR